MIPSLSQETLTQYASDAQTIQEPQGTDYSQGVRVGKTIPAKWWNWLFSAVTKRITQAKTDSQNMLDELKNAVTDAGIALDGNDSTQLAQAVSTKAIAQVNKFIEDKAGFAHRWIDCEAQGLLPAAGANSTYLVDKFKCEGGIYFMQNYVVRRTVGTVTVRLAFSANLTDWKLIAPSDLGLSSTWDTASVDANTITITMDAVYFAGAWLIHAFCRRQLQSRPISYESTLVRVPDLNDLSSKTVLFHKSIDSSYSDYRNNAFIVGNQLCWYEYTSGVQGNNILKVSTDGITFNSVTIGINSLRIDSRAIISKAIPFNGAYFIGCYLCSSDLTTWTDCDPNHNSMLTYNTIQLVSGAILVYRDSFSATSNPSYISPGSTQLTYLGSNTTIRHVTGDRKYCVYSTGGAYYVTEDFISSAPTYEDMVHGEAINGVFYVLEDKNSATKRLLSSTDVMGNVWTEVRTIPFSVGISYIYVYPELPFLFGAGGMDCKVSRDLGEHWENVVTDNGEHFNATAYFETTFAKDSMFFGARVTERYLGIATIPKLFYYTMNAANFVRGHTLYLH